MHWQPAAMAALTRTSSTRIRNDVLFMDKPWPRLKSQRHGTAQTQLILLHGRCFHSLLRGVRRRSSKTTRTGSGPGHICACLQIQHLAKHAPKAPNYPVRNRRYVSWVGRLWIVIGWPFSYLEDVPVWPSHCCFCFSLLPRCFRLVLLGPEPSQ